MKRPTLVNVLATHPKGEYIVAVVLDLHPDYIGGIVRQHTTNTVNIFYKLTGQWYKLCMSFEDYINFHEEYEVIDKRFKEDVDSFWEDNFKLMKNRNPNNDTDREAGNNV